MDVGSTCEGLIEWTPFVRDDATAPDARLGLLARAFRAMPGDARLASAYGALLMNQLAFEQAIEPLTAAVAATPSAAAPRTRLATCLVRLRNFKDALEALAFDGGEAPASVRAEAAYVRGAALAGLGDNGAAETALQVALDIEPNHSPAFRKLSAMLLATVSVVAIQNCSRYTSAATM